jgi:hypothetical protein
VIEVPPGEINYAEFFELQEIADKHWDLLQPALGKKKETQPLLKRFGDLRNSVAHSRELLPFERELLSGIAGEIRNRVTIFMSTQDPGGDFYPRIESIRDSFGNLVETFRPEPSLATGVETGVTLRPGDAVTFDCRGTDPQGRELRWWFNNPYGQDMVEARGTEAELTWHVGETDVGEDAAVMIRMASIGRYHRSGSHSDDPYDYKVLFSYRVLPPN